MLTEQNGIQVDKFYPPTDWQYSFPEGYTRLEYLQFTGTQYIELNFKANQDTRVITEVSFSNLGGDNIVFCSRDTKTSNTFTFLKISIPKLRADYNTSRIQILTPVVNTYYKVDFNKNNFYLNGNLEQTFTYTNFQSSYNMTIGCGSENGGTKASYLKGNLKQTIIFDNGTIVFNLVPAKRNSDNKPGMYDLVNDVFYVNQGTGEFVMGPELYSNNSQIDIRQKNNTNFVEKYEFNANDELTWANPNIYLTGKVNYEKVGDVVIQDGIASNFYNSRYLPLQKPFILNANTVAEFKFKIKLSSINVTSGIIGVPNSYGFHFIVTADNKLTLYIGNGSSWNILSAQKGTTTLSLNIDYYIKININRNNIICSLSTDDINYNIEFNVNITLNEEYSYNVVYGRTRENGQYLQGSIDLKETYIKVNDKLWFYGKNYTSENYAPVPAGLNYNNTTTPSIGYVNTQTQEFIPAPTDGIKYSQTRDIKVIPPEDNTITLLYGVASDFSKYSLFGLFASVSSGTYDVYIDDVLYATTASGTQTDIDFSALGAEYVSIGTCTTPEELVLHKIVIKPTNSGETITKFRCARTADVTTTQQQGVLWIHFELENRINVTNLFCAESQRRTYNLYAITAKNNKILVSATSNTSSSGIYSLAGSCSSLIYLPVLEFSNKNYSGGAYLVFNSVPAKRIIIKNNGSFNINVLRQSLAEKVEIENPVKYHSGTGNSVATGATNLKIYPKIITNDTTTTLLASNYNSLYPTKIDDSLSINREILRLNGTSTAPVRGIQGLKVSNEAPFSSTSSPQINVSYTGLDRDALVELFNSLPTVTGGQAIDITAAAGNNLTKVGNVVIDTNGVASGFSDSDYLNVVGNINLSSNFKIQIKITPSSVTTGSKKFLSIFYTNSIYLDFYTSGTAPRIDCQYRGSSYWTSIASNLSYDIPIVITISGNGKNLNVETNQNNISQSSSKTLQKLGIANIVANNIYLGRGHSTSLPMANGSIDLENTYIKVDQNYLMKGYLLDSDRAIATNKGWTITG